MKKVAIVGMGVGAETTTPEAREAVARAEVLLGAPNMLDLCKDSSKPFYPHYLPKDVAAVIEAENAREFAVLVSGDVGFYSAAAGLGEALAAYDLRFVPGLSTVSAFFARLRLPWQDAALVSAHGREAKIVDRVRRNRLTFCLTGSNAHELGKALSQAGFGSIQTHIGENFGTARERVYTLTVDDLARGQFPALTVLLFVNESFDDRTRYGLPDSGFARLAGIPMTKSETRALVLAKLGLRPTDLCWDVGAGTGSVTVEMALNAHRGHVYAVERREEAIPLIEQNSAAFRLGNVTAICGEAPEALDPLPAPDAVFIGGSGGEIAGIVAAALGRNPEVRIVVTAVTLETAATALNAFTKAGLDPEIVQLNVARGKRAGGLHLLEAQNPVTILCAGGKL